MNDRELTQLLARIAVADNRQVDQLVIAHWRDTIGDLDYTDAMAAVNMHFRESTAYLLPAHIVENVKRISKARAEQQKALDQDGVRPEDVGPTPDNFEAMAAAWNDPVAFAREVAIYNQQCIDGGFKPVYDGAA